VNVVVLDYGSGNLRSAERALERAGADVTVTASRREALAAAGLVVPGVGAYAHCMEGLLEVGGDEVVRERVAGGRPVLGICVGLQVLFERGVEFGIECAGVGALPGAVEKLEAPVLPHMGWNTVTPPASTVLFKGVEAEHFYFVHSYAGPAEIAGAEVTTAAHGSTTFAAAVESGVLCGTQFHPEKSGDAGLALLENWIRSL
jgi:glutamine amidotransferase